MNRPSSPKPSRTKLTSPSPEFAFFTDRDLGNAVPDALARAGYRVERHSSHFDQAAADVDFIPMVGTHPDWIMLTHDGNQRIVADERNAIMRCGVPLFIHVGRLKMQDQAASFVLLAPKMIAFVRKHGRPFIAKVYRPEQKTTYRTVAGPIKMVLTFEEWRATQSD